MNFLELIIYFFIYSILGYLCEVIYCSAIAKKWVDRGFFYGPWCPIYGFGATFVILLLTPFKDNLIIFFIAAIIVTSTLEYFTSWALEKLFNLKWWDYSQHKFNLKGRICLLNSIEFGLLSLFLIYIVEPFFVSLIQPLSYSAKRLISYTTLIIFLVDFIFSINSVMDFEKTLKEFENFKLKLKEFAKKYSIDSDSFSESFSKLRETAQNSKDSGLLDFLEKYKVYNNKNLNKFRLLRVYPNLHHIALNETLNEYKENVKEKLDEVNEIAQQKVQEFSENISAFKNDNNVYKLFWIFLEGCIIGYSIETIYHYLSTGMLDSRQGLIYGPINPIYGLGTIIIYIIFNKVKEKKLSKIIIASTVIGTVLELISSFFLEIAYSVTPYYQSRPTAILNGRTSISSIFLWVVFGLAMVKFFLPRTYNFLQKLSNRQNLLFSWIIIVVIVLNFLSTSTAFYRWSKRAEGIKPQNSFDDFIDTNYDDDFMEEIFPNVTFME